MSFFGVITANPTRFFRVDFSGIQIQLLPDLRPTLNGGFLRAVRSFAPTLALFVASVFCLHCAKPTVSQRVGLGPALPALPEDTGSMDGSARSGGRDYQIYQSHQSHQTYQTGYASWYGSENDGFQYKQTANGETMMPDAWTCAHPFLPFGTIVNVENLSNKTSVLLRVNDRGPYIKGRIIDLSRQGAEQIGLLKSGITEVRIHVVKNILQTNTSGAFGKASSTHRAYTGTHKATGSVPQALRALQSQHLPLNSSLTHSPFSKLSSHRIHRPIPVPVNTPFIMKNIDFSNVVKVFADTVLKPTGCVSKAVQSPLSSFFQSLEEAFNRFRNRRVEPFIRKM